MARAALRRLRFLEIVIACLLPSGCLKDNIHIESVELESQGVVPGPPVPEMGPWLHAVFWRADGKVHVLASRMTLCSAREVGELRRQGTMKKEVTMLTAVAASVVGATGLLVYMLPDIPSEDSVLYGSVLLGTGAVIYGVPKLLETEKSAPIPNQPVWRPSEPVRCALSPLAHEDIQVYDAAGMLEQKTDAYGRASLARDVTEPVTVFIGQERAQEVEWR